MSKLRVTEALIEKAKKVFEQKEGIRVREGLDRKELRALERAGIVEKMPVYGERRYTDVSPSMSYIWKLRSIYDFSTSDKSKQKEQI